MTGTAAVEAAVADAHRHEWGTVLAATARVTRDLDLAEECVQEAYAAALRTWGGTVRRGADPRGPGGPGPAPGPDAQRADAGRNRGPRATGPAAGHRRAPGDQVDAAGRLVRLANQDRSAWDRAALAEADAMIVGCLRAGAPGRYALQAAIASLYAEPASYDQTDWPQLLALYDRLLQVWPSPVVALNRTVPLAMVAGPGTALAEVERLERDERLAGYHYLPAIKADLLTRLGRTRAAAAAYRQALALAANDAERAFPEEQLAGPRSADPA